ncbi:MAG: hypothetical protein Q9181_007797 [Wetmoreana brouardii]
MWKSKRNVSITYTPLPNDDGRTSSVPRLNDLVSYQTLKSQKVKTVEGIDTPSPPKRGGKNGGGGEWDWRGKGWLRVARSHWEALGWGNLPDESADGGEKGGGKREEEEGNQWAVTYFAKTFFTPAGIDVYSRRKEGVGESVLDGIKEALGRSEDEGIRKLAGEVFEVRRD